VGEAQLVDLSNTKVSFGNFETTGQPQWSDQGLLQALNWAAAHGVELMVVKLPRASEPHVARFLTSLTTL